MSWSKNWDRMCRDAVASGQRDVLRTGREIEMRTLSLVLFPASIQDAWNSGEFGTLGYLAEAVAAWPPRDLEHTDHVLFQNLQNGLAAVRAAGWPERLDAGRLHRLEAILQEVLANQRTEGSEPTVEEVAEVRRRLARHHLGKWPLSTECSKPPS